ncbi:hypothetical protein EYW49_01405 [Siculibacillus lacustris]|uniref:Potassium channel protein n=1 Tax=Siculibacillus lacustris TaxID=1549641 RepID=A0A4Q9VYW9_9HYPH|nr:ion channel [Siculibacillus lacustris]TBW41411.1 hypothetical protein EYW49_01405 [Siculibacillus lacustris]
MFEDPPAHEPTRTPVRAVRVGDREVLVPRRDRHFWSDLHHRAVTIGWPAFFLIAASLFLSFNLVFASLYRLGTAPIANVADDGFLGLFWFSIETLATVGYGDMHPQTTWGHIVATCEIFTGMSLMAVMTGLVFTRFSRPLARFVFARHPVVAPVDGRPTLMIRLANQRANAIAGATAKLWLVRNEVGVDGTRMRRFYELALQRRENPVFALSWTLFHDLDDASPLCDVAPESLATSNAEIVLTVTGTDENTSQQLHARHTYRHGDLRWNHRYADILVTSPDGRPMVDQSRFHEVVAVGTPVAPEAT